MSKYGSRKFLFALLVVASATYLVAEHSISDTVYQFVVSAVVAAYLTANVAQRAVDKKAAAQ